MDDQDAFRCHAPGIHFYRKNLAMEGKDPVNIIRDAIAKALVFYYPFAGRLRECGGRKLAVECNGEGVLFVEADADVMFQQFGNALYPPFPNLEELLHDIPGSDEIINCPILLIQVTRLKCGGFIFAYRFNHTMCDGAEFFQFISTVGELSRGAAVPSITPVWERHLLTARRPPHVTFTNREYDVIPDTSGSITPFPLDKFVQHSFFFCATDISALRSSLPPHLQTCSKFDVVAACAWRCWTIAVSPEPDEEITFAYPVDIRKRMNPPLPAGYYGNAIVPTAAVTTAAKLSENPLHYAVELVRKAKCEATDEYVRSAVDMAVKRVPPSFTVGRTYAVSDVTHAGFERVEFGWGTAAYGGVAKGICDWIPILPSWYIPFKNEMGEEGIMVPVCLPLDAMEVFEKQLQMIMISARTSSRFKMSAL